MIFPLGAIGAFLAWRQRRNSALLTYLTCYALVLLLFFVSARYRLPMIPVLAIFAGFAAEQGQALWKAGRRRYTLALVAAVLLLGVFVRLDWLGADAVDEADGHYFMAKAQANSDLHSAAVESLEKALTIDPLHWDALFDLAAAWTNLGQPQRAVPLYERILADHPEDTESTLAVADALRRLGRWREAVDRVREGAMSPLAAPDLVFAASRMLFSWGNTEEAVSVAVAGLEQGVKHPDLEELVVKMRRGQAERERVAACLEESPGPAAGLPSAAQKSLDQAEQWLQRNEHLEAELLTVGVLVDCDGYAAAWNLLGKLWFLQGSPLAPAALRRAIGARPGAGGGVLRPRPRSRR